jgi:hypothetical protein
VKRTTIVRVRVRLVVRSGVRAGDGGTDKRKQSLYFPESM